MVALCHRGAGTLGSPFAWLALVFAVLLASADFAAAGSMHAEEACLSDEAAGSVGEDSFSVSDLPVLEASAETPGPSFLLGDDDDLFGSRSSGESREWTSWRVEVDRDDDPASGAALHWSRGSTRGLQAGDSSDPALRDTTHLNDYELAVELGLIDDRVVYSLAFEREGSDEPPAFASHSWIGSTPAAWRTTRAGIAFDLDPRGWSPRVRDIPVVGFLPSTLEVGVSSSELDAYVPESESVMDVELGWDLGLAEAALSFARSRERSGLGEDRDGLLIREGEFEVEFEGERWSVSAELAASRVDYDAGMWLVGKHKQGAELEFDFEPTSFLPMSFTVGYQEIDGYGFDYSYSDRVWSSEVTLDLSGLLSLLRLGDDVSLELEYEVERERSRDSDNDTMDEIYHSLEASFECRF